MSERLEIGDVFVKEFFLVCFRPDGMEGMFICGGDLGAHPVLGKEEQPQVTPMIGTELERAEAQYAASVEEIKKQTHTGGGTLMLIRLHEGRIVKQFTVKDKGNQQGLSA